MLLSSATWSQQTLWKIIIEISKSRQIPPKILSISVWQVFLSEELRNGGDDQDITRKSLQKVTDMCFTIREVGNCGLTLFIPQKPEGGNDTLTLDHYLGH